MSGYASNPITPTAPDHSGPAKTWVQAALADLRADLRGTAAWQLLVGLGATAAWYVAMTGLYGIPYVILGFIGVGFPFSPWVFGALWLVPQFVLYPLARRKGRPGYRFEHAPDNNEIVAVAPPRAVDDPEAFGQDHGFSFLRATGSVYFYAAAAFDAAWRDFATARALDRLDTTDLAALVEQLLARPRKVGFHELATALPGRNLPQLLEQAAKLPGIHIHTQDPQGISLTDAARQSALPAQA